MAPGSQSFLVPRPFLAAMMLAASAAVLLSVPAEARRLAPLVQEESSGFTTHMTRVVNFRCSEPQPRAIPSNDVVTEGISPEEHIMPPMTVLHRCDSGSGCCDQAVGLSCSPTEGGVETVPLVFLIEGHFTKTTKFVTAQAVNHTACECRNSNAV